MKEIKKYILNDQSIDDISREISRLLSESHVASQEVTKSRLIAEDALITWKGEFGEKEVTLTQSSGRLGCRFRLELAGAKLDPLDEQSSEYSISAMLAKKLDNGINYKYRGGRNILSASYAVSDNAFVVRALGTMVLPIALQTLLTNVVTSSDALMLGALNQASLAAVSLAAQIMFIFTSLISALVTGTTNLCFSVLGQTGHPLRGKYSRNNIAVLNGAGSVVLGGMPVFPPASNEHSYE